MKSTRGYVALIAVLIIGAAALSISLSLLTLGTDSQREALVEQQSTQARSLATACAEEALQYLHDNSTGGASSGGFSEGQGTCTYTITVGPARQIDATGTVGNVVRKIRVSATISGPNISITSWQEVADFL